MTATPHIVSIWTDLFQSIVSSGKQLRWRGDGPGIGRDAKTAYSSLLGRFLARAYLTEFEGVRVLVPLDVAKRWLEETQYEIIKDPSSNGLEADWVGLDRNGLVIVEAKGSYDKTLSAWKNSNGMPSVLRTAIGQANRTAVFRRSPTRKLPSKRWAIASRWGTEQNSRDPTLIAWDPDEGALAEEDYKALENILFQADLQSVGSALGITGGVEALSRQLTADADSEIRLSVGDRTIEPGANVAIGPFGFLPIRTEGDLLSIQQARELTTNLAVASLSGSYIRSVREGKPPQSSPMLQKERDASHSGLTVIWPKANEEIDIEP